MPFKMTPELIERVAQRRAENAKSLFLSWCDPYPHTDEDIALQILREDLAKARDKHEAALRALAGCRCNDIVKLDGLGWTAGRTPIEANIPLDGEWTVIGIEDMGDPVVHLLRYDSNTCVRAYADRIVSCAESA